MAGEVARKRGRPRRVDSACASERIWAWLTPDERAALVEVAAENGLTTSQMIRDAVNGYVADYSDRRVLGRRPRRFSVTHKSGEA